MTVTAEGIAQDVQLKYADKIAKLFNLAENAAATAEEAETYMKKAAQLMLEYAIDEQMLAAARGLEVDLLVQDEFRYQGIYRVGHQRLGGVVAAHFGLRPVYGHDSYSKPKYMPLYLTGFQSDVERARLLDTSLQLQAVTAMSRWAKTIDFSWMDKGLAFRTRRDFVFGFSDGVQTKLWEAKRAARAEAVKHQAERAGESAEAAGESVSLVLVDRKKKVDDYYDKTWGGRTRNINHKYEAGVGGRNAGHEAGRNANTNTSAAGLRGTRGAVGA